MATAEGLISLTEAAVLRARELVAARGGDAFGIRLAVRTTGCSGYSYLLDFAGAPAAGDMVVEQAGVRIVVDPEAAVLVAGTEVDFVEDRLGSQFVFRNPHEKARCGCGESFSV
jgi:iron-sulfur cluster assembly protein